MLSNSAITASTSSATIAGVPSSIGIVGSPVGNLLLLENPGGASTFQTNESAIGFSKGFVNRGKIGTSGDNLSIDAVGSLAIRTGGSVERIRVNNDGMVGIRTSNPSHRLHINSLANEGALRVQVNGATRLLVSANEGVNIGTANDHAPARSLYVDNSILVNRTTPVTGYRLAVRGKAICEEVKVQLASSWPDYVFADGYGLMPLDELSGFISTHKHLPGLPSAHDVHTAEGIELGEMQRLTVEKVEELTLYLLEQNKMIKDQQSMIQELRNEINALKQDRK